METEWVGDSKMSKLRPFSFRMSFQIIGNGDVVINISNMWSRCLGGKGCIICSNVNYSSWTAMGLRIVGTHN